MMIMEESHIWLTLERLIRLLVQDRYGHIKVKGRGVTLVRIGGRAFINPGSVIRAEVRDALELGRLTAYGEPNGSRLSDEKYRAVLPVEWTTISLHPFWPSHFKSLRVRRDEAAGVWPSLNPKGLVPAQKHKSPFNRKAAHEIFRRFSGWPGKSQGHAARELAALYSSEVSSLSPPSVSSFERWVREWSRNERVIRPSVGV